jgi:carbamoyltransferase
MTAILGISAFYHDSAAALVVDGEIVAAAQEERFTRKKHDAEFPTNAIQYCLETAGLRIEDLDHVAFYDKPFLKFERLLETYVSYGPVGFQSFLKAMPIWLKQKLYIPRELNRGLQNRFKKRYIFTEHHESHAASAFFPSPFEEAAVMTLDGVGEWATASYGVGRGNNLTLTHELHFPHSLGLLYSAFTYYTGFKVNSGEYKLMGLAPYGEPKYVDLIRENLLDLKPDGSFRMDMSYFNYCQGLTMTSAKFDKLFGAPARKPETPISQREMDIAASIQQVTEDIMLRMARHVHAETGTKNLCLAGGVALNCVGNGRILREGPFENIWIQPAAGDAGGALGAALFVWYQLLGNERRVSGKMDLQHGSLLGPRFADDEIRSFLDGVGAVYHHHTTDDALVEQVAGLLASENVVGWFQDRMEFGPRALGARSIIGDARSTAMQSVMNLKIKFRESFRPFAPSVLEEKAPEYFGIRPGVESPYMLLVAPVNDSRRKKLNGDQSHLQGIEKLKIPRSDVPAITHVDYSARVQTVDPERHGRYRKLIERFDAKTGCPVIINTSFNVRGEPIVCTPADAHRCFLNTNMDVLVLERFVLLKKEQPNAGEIDNEAYLAQFALD